MRLTIREEAVRMLGRRQPASRRVLGLFVAIAALLTFFVDGSGALAWQAATADEALAERHAPVIIVQGQTFPCDPDGEPYLPAPVDVVFADPAVVLREGPDQEPVKSPVENADLFALDDQYATDFPGTPRTPGCDYETHFKQVMGDRSPVVYAHIATEEGRRGVALQYWFFYYFNDFNNLHEGDWEMIQLLFDAATVEEALTQEPVRVAFAQHSGGETADWTAPKLERQGERPVIYASRGSHASYYGPGLWLGWGRDGSGLGCDITSGNPVRIDPEVRLIPETITGKNDPFAWATFAGRWGERETWVYNGPTGPTQKPQWSAPLSWMDTLRADSIRVGAAVVLGPAPSDVFCNVVENGSGLFTLFKPYPALVIAIAAALAGIAAMALRLTWPALRETWPLYRAHLPVFAGIGGVMVPALLVVSVVQYLLANNPDFAARASLSEDNALLQAGLSTVSFLQRLLILLIVTPAVIFAVGDIMSGRPPSVLRSLREAIARLPELAWTLIRGGLVVIGLLITLIGIPWAINRWVRWMLGPQAVMLERLRGKPALDDSSRAVQGHWWTAAASWGTLAFLGATPGIIIALALLILARFPIDVATGVSSLIYAVSYPFAIAGMTVLYLHWRRPDGQTARRQEEPES
jgi:hypothetical protein